MLIIRFVKLTITFLDLFQPEIGFSVSLTSDILTSDLYPGTNNSNTVMFGFDYTCIIYYSGNSRC